MRCNVRQGDAIFVPSFWHHAVLSSAQPGGDCLNVGVNFWYASLRSTRTTRAPR